jgi:dipeptidyl aminopeptidase/acylaminoacyl peptidase
MRLFFCTAMSVAISFGATAQSRQFTNKDYQQAERFLFYNTDPLVDHASVRPVWLSGNRFYYRDLNANGSQFILVDPARKTKQPAFDHEKLAAALSAATGKSFTGNGLPFSAIDYSADNKQLLFQSSGRLWKYNLQTAELSSDTSAKSSNTGYTITASRGDRWLEVPSPDGKKAAFIKDYNLWVRDLASGQQTQLTTDGVKDNGYATDNAGWVTSDRAILSWSPDSKKIATFKQDQRNVSDMYLVTTNVGKPTLKQWKYPLPGDKDIPMIQRVIIDVNAAKVIVLQIPPDPHRATLGDDISSSGGFDDVDWSADGNQLAFVSTSRDHKQEKIRIADANTGAVREVFEETVPTQFESGWGTINWRYFSATNEIMWFSERDNWGHLYLYDATTGKLKNQITKGNWLVSRLINVDEKKREVYFIANGRQAKNPYFGQFCKASFDGKKFTVLTPEEGEHRVTLSPSGKYFVDTYSQPDVPSSFVVRSIDGKLAVTLDKTDLSRLTATGWKLPTPFTVKAHDGTTDIYGIMYTPSNLDVSKKYPIIDYIYPGPQGGSVGSWAFTTARLDHQALAELGFIVIALEGTSNPLRSKSFHDMSYGNMAENTLPDQVGGIRQLAQRFNYVDTTRVGIWGHSGGGFATATAMFKYPDFFKVGISESGNHDNRNYEDDWGERYNGLVTASNYDAQANQNYVKNLKGKLMLAHGLMDNNVPPYNTLLVVEALEKANKDFDLVIFPNSQHGYGPYSLYMMRRRWDYFVKNLMGGTPPDNYQLESKTDPRVIR